MNARYKQVSYSCITQVIKKRINNFYNKSEGYFSVCNFVLLFYFVFEKKNEKTVSNVGTEGKKKLIKNFLNNNLVRSQFESFLEYKNKKIKF